MPSFRNDYTIYPRKLKNKTVYYYRTYTPDGSRTAGKSTGCKTKTEARNFCNNLLKEGKLYSGTEITFKAFSDNWFVWGKCAYLKDRLASGTKKKQAITEGYAKILRNALRLYILPYFSKSKLKAITPAKIKAWRVWLQEEKKIANSTINNASGALRIMTDWALNENLIMFDPFRSVKPLMTDDNAREAFTLEEGREILNNQWLCPMARLYSLTAAVTGMREAEIRAIRKETIHENYIDVTHQYSSKGLVSIKTKEKRKVPISKKLFDLLQAERKEREFVFQIPGEKHPVSRHYIVYRLDKAMPKKIFEQKATRKLCFHSWRHFYNSFLRSENVTDAKIRAVMGHSSGKGTMTDEYTSWTPEMYPEVYAAHNKLIEYLLKSDDK